MYEIKKRRGALTRLITALTAFSASDRSLHFAAVAFTNSRFSVVEVSEVFVFSRSDITNLHAVVERCKDQRMVV